MSPLPWCQIATATVTATASSLRRASASIFYRSNTSTAAPTDTCATISSYLKPQPRRQSARRCLAHCSPTFPPSRPSLQTTSSQTLSWPNPRARQCMTWWARRTTPRSVDQFGRNHERCVLRMILLECGSPRKSHRCIWTKWSYWRAAANTSFTTSVLCVGRLVPPTVAWSVSRTDLYCRACIVGVHADSPLHKVEVWKEDMFERTTLKALGLRIQLGHGKPGKGRRGRCVLASEAVDDYFVVVAANGIHERSPTTSSSYGPDGFRLRARILAPQRRSRIDLALNSTTPWRGRPTIRERKQFGIDTTSFSAWRMLKPVGRGHAPDGVDGTKDGECALLCPACPQPGKNLPPNWKNAPKESTIAVVNLSGHVAHDDNFTSTLVPKSKIAKFLDEGLKIQDNQLKLKHLIQDTTEHDLQAWRKEIAGRTSKLRDQIAAFRRDQKHFMAKVGDKVAAQTALGTPIEDEKLFLPSDLTGNERQKMDVVALGHGGNNRQQKQNSRAGDQIAEATKRQNYRIESYSAARLALISLNGSTDFPVLTEADLFMKSVQQKRRVGDSKRTDGLLWRATALATIGSYDSEVEMGELEQAEEGGDHGQAQVGYTTISSVPPESDCDLGAKPKKIAEKSNKDEMERPEGWLWQLGKLTKMSSTEMEAWSNEGDRVQWFRAEAEMQRWQEQWEQKLVELLRTRRSFGKMESVWAQLADMQPSEAHGAKAYARQKAAMYARRKSEAEMQVKKVGYGQLLDETANVVALVEAERKTEAAVIDAALNGRRGPRGRHDGEIIAGKRSPNGIAVRVHLPDICQTTKL
ncbi:hypothetical protein B0H11DRAFT_2184477 [Mycena galericulata]|nr:hypothetical protein B0H11DRAFT_2184477 [Mycena galericulata]